MTFPQPERAAWGFFCVLCCLLPAIAGAEKEAASTTVNVERDGPLFRIHSVSRVFSGMDTAWSVLTDYEGYVNFVPGMTRSHRLDGQPIRVEQRGEFGVLFFRVPVYATLEVEESMPSKVHFRALEGNVRSLVTSVELRDDGDYVLVTYRSVIEPDFWVPPLIGTPLVRAAIGRKLDAVAVEIERRAALSKVRQ